LNLTFEDGAIFVYRLGKCGSNGTILLKLLEEYARSVGIREIGLQDMSVIQIDCEEDGYVFTSKMHINLAVLKLLTTGKSWYNSLGYFSSFHDNTEEIAALPCNAAINLCKKEKINIILTSYSDETTIETKIDEVNRETRNILNRSRRLFPYVDLNLSVREYLKAILPDKFVREGKCREYKFIKDFIDFISILLNYDGILTKTLVTGGRKRTRYKRKNNGSRKAKSGKLRK